MADDKCDSVSSLRHYVDARFNDSQRAIDAAMSAMNERLAGMNEFRNALGDQAAKMITRPEHDALAKYLDEKISPLATFKAEMNGSIRTLYAIIMLIVTILGTGIVYIGVRAVPEDFSLQISALKHALDQHMEPPPPPPAPR